MSETSQNNLSEQIYHHGKPFLSGGLAGMTATVVVQPIDMLKVQIQLSAQRPWFVMRDVVRREGFFGLYRGLSAGLLRQATYTTARLGFFNVMMEVKIHLCCSINEEDLFSFLFTLTWM